MWGIPGIFSERIAGRTATIDEGLVPYFEPDR
jgi:hypothetical protein